MLGCVDEEALTNLQEGFHKSFGNSLLIGQTLNFKRSQLERLTASGAFGVKPRLPIGARSSLAVNEEMLPSFPGSGSASSPQKQHPHWSG